MLDNELELGQNESKAHQDTAIWDKIHEMKERERNLARQIDDEFEED